MITDMDTTKKQFIIQYNSPVILTYAFVALAALLLGLATGGHTTTMFFTVYKTSWADPLQYTRLFTHVIGHINLDHYFGNFLLVLLVGPMIEEKYGSKKLLILIIVTALITGLINILFFKQGLLGASGVVFMLILLGSYANFQKGRIPLTLILVVIAFIGKEAVDGLFTMDNISHLTHIIGGTIGGIVGYFISDKKSFSKIDDMRETAMSSIAETDGFAATESEVK